MDLIHGGLADNKSPSDFDEDAIKQGIKVEMEHTDNPMVAREIAMDHLTEDPEYYDKLARMEAGACDKMLSNSIPFFLEKASYWQHADGSYWWRNPKTDKIEPYTPGKKKVKITPDVPTNAEKLKDIPPDALSSALLSARLLITHLQQMPQQEALGVLTQYSKLTASSMTDTQKLRDAVQAYKAIGLNEAASVFAERLNDIEGMYGDIPVQETLKDNQVLLDGKPVDFKVVKTNIGGSTGAYVVEAGGDLYVVKEYHGNENQVRNEFLANALYNTFNLHQSPLRSAKPVPESKIAKTQDKELLFSPFVKNLNTLEDMDLDDLEPEDHEEVLNSIKSNFVLDAWLANWDVVGLTEDNIGVSTREGIPVVTRLDNGGALLYRAQGAPKGNAFGDKVTELDTMRDFNMAPSAAEYFSTISDSELIDSLNAFEKKVQRIGVSGIFDLINSAGFPEEVAESLTMRLMNRFDYMMDYKDSLEEKKREKIAKDASKAQKTGIHETGDSAFEAFKKIKLNPSQRLSIKAFTKSAEEDDIRNYVTINQDIVKGFFTEEAQDLLDAIENLPRVNSVTLRGISEYDHIDSHWENWTSGKWSTVEWKAFSSSTMNPGMAFDANGSISFVIKNRGIHGRYIAPASDMVTEDEVLYKPNSKFRVVGYSYTDGSPITAQGNHMTSTLGNTIILEELTEEEYNKMPASQEPPKQFKPQDVMAYIQKNSHPTDVNELTAYKKQNPF